MKLILIVAAILFSTITFAQGEKNFIDKNYIEVTGKAEMDFTPDKIYIQVLLSEKDAKAKNTVTEQEQKMLQKLQELSIDIKKDVTIKDLTSSFKARLLSKDVLLSKQYQIIVHDGKLAGNVFLALEDIGISNASIEKLESSKIEDYRQQVKVTAIKAAKNKAELLTESVGQKAGKALFIQEQNIYAQPMYTSNVMLEAKARGFYDAADLNFENLKVEATVLCRFEIL